MRFDYVIVGAGTAGCVLASRLSEDPDVSVVLIEAGGWARKPEVAIPAAFHRLFQGPLDWGYRTVPQAGLDDRRILFPRGKMVGGSASLNAMMVLRGHSLDHDEWELPGFTSGELQPCYERSAAGPFPIDSAPRHPLTHAFVEAAVAAGLRRSADLNAPDNEGVGLVPTSTRRGRRFSVARGYLKPALRRRNLTLLTRAQATKVLVRQGQARGVEVLLDGHEEDVQAGLEVILAAGAVDTPKLLLLSGIGAADQLAEHGLPQLVHAPEVGRNLFDHLACGIAASVADLETLATADKLRHLLRWMATGGGPLGSNVAEGAAFVRTDPRLPAPDLELIFAPVLFEDEGLGRPTEHGVMLATILLRPRSRGTVALASPDPLTPPLIDPRYLSDPEGVDAGTLLHGLRLARRVAGQQPLARHLSGEREPGSEAKDDEALLAHVRNRGQTLYHPVGTCRAGTDDASVVDPLLRVRGVERLRVVDASVFPLLPRGHPNWPVVAVAERASVLIASAP